jgi:hypothetical protein
LTEQAASGRVLSSLALQLVASASALAELVAPVRCSLIAQRGRRRKPALHPSPRTVVSASLPGLPARSTPRVDLNTFRDLIQTFFRASAHALFLRVYLKNNLLLVSGH